MLPVRLSNDAVLRLHRLHGSGMPMVFLHGLGCASSSDYAAAAGSLEWAGTLRVASPLAVHRSACSLVRGTNPSWRAVLQGLRMPRTVLFGETSLPDGNHEALPRAGVAVGVVPRAGHSMAWESPAGLAEALAQSVPR